MPTPPPTLVRRISSAARIALTAALTLVLVVGPASAAMAEPWFNEGFNRGETDVFTGWGWKDSKSGHAGAGLFTRIQEDSHYGAQTQLELSALGLHDRDEMYWRYWLRLDPDFYVSGRPAYRGKLPGPAGLYSSGCRGGRVSTESRPCWSARTMFSRDSYPSPSDKDYIEKPNERTLLGSYVYHLDHEDSDSRGEIITWDEKTGMLDHGRWYCIEGRVQLNTPGKSNGVLQNWVDGKTALDRRDFRFRRAGEGQLHVKSMWMEVYYGGSGTSPRDNDLWLDSLVLSPHRVGCGDEHGYHFTDHTDSVHRANIDWFGARGITRGCDPPDNRLYCPEAPVTRGQMAVFLTRTLELPPGSGDSFHDDDGSQYEAAIEALAAAGVTKGCNPPHNDRFCPGDPVTRGEMAAFIKRAWSLPPGESKFTDVADSPFVKDIGAIARAGVTKGCNPPENDKYCPTDPVTRAQMATFVRRVAVRFPR